jgi:hypothetical protein
MAMGGCESADAEGVEEVDTETDQKVRAAQTPQGAATVL